MTRISVEELLNESASDVEERRMTMATMTLVFVTVSDNCKYSRQWSINSATATKLTLKEFMRFMKSKCTRIAHALPKDPRMFYTDEEDDDIFVGSDDEYKEMVKEGVPMVINCVKKNGVGPSKKDGRRADVLCRDSKTSPGKVTKFPSTRLRSRAAQTQARPISLTLKYSDELKELSDELKKTNISVTEDKSACVLERTSSPVSEDIRRQQASVFDWMSSARAGGQEDVAPPAWFQAFMENFKEDLVAEISAKVVQSLGVVIDNKLAGFEKKKSQIEQKKEEKVVVGKAKKSRDTEKVKKEAMRMSMEINDETESKELKKLRKSLMKKTDKVVKIAMKIEKKQNQEEKRRKPSLSSVGSDSGISIQVKKEKKEKKKKINRSKDCKVTEKGVNSLCESIIYPVLAKPNYPLSPVKAYPVVPVVQNYPIVKSPDRNESIIDKILAINGLREDIIKNLEAEVSAKQFAVKENLEIVKPDGKLANAVYVSESNNVMKAAAGSEVSSSLKITNMGCFEWTDDVSLQQVIAHQHLVTESKSVNLSGIVPGEEKEFEFGFKTPSEPGVYESVFNFFVENERFGPVVTFKFIVPSEDEKEDAIEMKDYKMGVEMKNLGSSASSLEMVEIIEKKRKEDDGFDLLAHEVDSLNIEKKSSEDDFEVIQIPSCFDLSAPFDFIDETEEPEKESKNYDKESESKNQQAKSSESDFEHVKNLATDSASVPLILKSMVDQNPMEELVKMGFGNRDHNKRLLDLYNNDLEKVLQVVHEENQVDWAGMRH